MQIKEDKQPQILAINNNSTNDNIQMWPINITNDLIAHLPDLKASENVRVSDSGPITLLLGGYDKISNHWRILSDR